VIEGRTDGIVGAGTGVALGGIAGQRVEEAVSRRQGIETTVRLDNGGFVSVVQEVNQNQLFALGDRVRVLGQGQTMRVTR